MRIYVLSAIMIFGLVNSAAALPALTPLWKLIELSDAIVYAEVVSVVDDYREHDSHLPRAYLAKAHLRVVESYKGIHIDNYQVRVEQWQVCPEPANYKPGEHVIAFLRRFQGDWVTTAFSQGLRYPTDEAVLDYKTVITQAVSLQAQHGVKPPPELFEAWLKEVTDRVNTQSEAKPQLRQSGIGLKKF